MNMSFRAIGKKKFENTNVLEIIEHFLDHEDTSIRNNVNGLLFSLF